MLPLPRTSYEAPDTVEEAVRLGAEPGARFISGGTDLLPSMKQRVYQPALLVSTRRLAPLWGIEAGESGALALGAGLSLRHLATHPDVSRRYPALAAAARTVATPTIQGMATLGGNLMLDTRCVYYNQPAGWRAALGGCLKCEGTICHVAPKGKGCYAAQSADTVPVLSLLGAIAVFEAGSGTVRVPVAELYAGDGRDWITAPRGALLTHVELPAPGSPIAYRKLRQRGAIDYGLLLTAVQRHEGGFRAVISAVGPAPISVSAPDGATLEAAAYAAVQPLATHLPAATWRKKLVKVEVRRAVMELGQLG